MCLDDVARCMESNRLQLNTDKTELLWCATARRQDQLPSAPLRTGTCSVYRASSVRDLGIFIDANLTMQTHVRKTVSACFAVMRQPTGIRRSVPVDAYKSLIISLVISGLDYGNATLYGFPNTTLVILMHALKYLQRNCIPKMSNLFSVNGNCLHI